LGLGVLTCISTRVLALGLSAFILFLTRTKLHIIILRSRLFFIKIAKIEPFFCCSVQETTCSAFCIKTLTLFASSFVSLRTAMRLLPLLFPLHLPRPPLVHARATAITATRGCASSSGEYFWSCSSSADPVADVAA
jgi:hypothetical protein